MMIMSASRIHPNSIGFRIIRFGLAGLVNTAFSYAIFLFFLQIMFYPLAYAVAYAAGIVSSYVLNVRFVFRTRYEIRTALKFPLVHALQFGFGVVALPMLVRWGGLTPAVAGITVIALSSFLAYCASCLLFAQRADQA